MKYSKIIPFVMVVAISGLHAMEQETCDICFDKKRTRDFTTLSCNHRYCTACLRAIVDMALKAKNMETLRCPNPNCNHGLNEQDIKNVTHDQKIVDTIADLQTRRLLIQQGFKNCPTPDCQFLFHDEGMQQTIRCPQCRREYCSHCLLAHNENISCDEAKERETITDNELWIKKFTKACPKCGYRIEKNGGCPNMVCEKCRHHFRWDQVQFDPIVPQTSNSSKNTQNDDWIKNNTKPCPKCGARIEKNGGCQSMTCGNCKHVFQWDAVTNTPLTPEQQKELEHQALKKREEEGLQTALKLDREEHEGPNIHVQVDFVAHLRELMEREEREEREQAIRQVQELEENEKREKVRQEQLKQEEIELNRQREEQRVKEEKRKQQDELSQRLIEQARIIIEKEEEEEAIRQVQEFEEHEKREKSRKEQLKQQEIEPNRQKEKQHEKEEKGKQLEKEEPREKEKTKEESDTVRVLSTTRITLYPRNIVNEFLHNDFRAPFVFNGQNYMTVNEAFQKLAKKPTDFLLMNQLIAVKLLSNQELRHNLAEFPLHAQFINNSRDPYWGMGVDGKGKDMLGLILNGVRFSLQNPHHQEGQHRSDNKDK